MSTGQVSVVDIERGVNVQTTVRYTMRVRGREVRPARRPSVTGAPGCLGLTDRGLGARGWAQPPVPASPPPPPHSQAGGSVIWIIFWPLVGSVTWCKSSPK